MIVLFADALPHRAKIANVVRIARYPILAKMALPSSHILPLRGMRTTGYIFLPTFYPYGVKKFLSSSMWSVLQAKSNALHKQFVASALPRRGKTLVEKIIKRWHMPRRGYM